MKRILVSIMAALMVLAVLLMPTAVVAELEREGTTKAPTSSDPSGTATFADLDLTTLTPEDLAATLVGPGVTIVPGSVSYTGAPEAAGTFLFTNQDDVIGISSGIILSSGKITDVEGPNTSNSTSTAFGLAGDDDLTLLSGFETFDAAILEFEFEVDEGAEKVRFRYVFGSEEYNEWVYTEYNDVFAFWVNGVNYAVVNGEPVSIDTINHGAFADMVDPSHLELYINNDPIDGGVDPDDVLHTEMDGFTVVLIMEAPVNAGANTMRLAIADAGDDIYDSWVFIEEGSLTVVPPEPDITVGGDVYPVNKVGIIAPWLILGAIIIAGGTVIMRRRANNQRARRA